MVDYVNQAEKRRHATEEQRNKEQHSWNGSTVGTEKFRHWLQKETKKYLKNAPKTK